MTINWYLFGDWYYCYGLQDKLKVRIFDASLGREDFLNFFKIISELNKSEWEIYGIPKDKKDKWVAGKLEVEENFISSLSGNCFICFYLTKGFSENLFLFRDAFLYRIQIGYRYNKGFKETAKKYGLKVDFENPNILLYKKNQEFTKENVEKFLDSVYNFLDEAEINH